MLTPQKIQDLSDPIESVYISMTNELLVNIGRHVTNPTWTHTAAWEIQKLSELGQLTRENAAIINRWVAQLPEEIRATMEETRRVALEGIEQQLAKAAEEGYVTPPMRDSTYEVLREYSQQAANQLNLVNTTMLQSSVAQYERLVDLTDQEYGRLMAQKEATQEALNIAAGSVASGTQTRTQALQWAIRKVSEEGLTGFYDRAGRSWSPEAYVNMDIRTTVHNVAIQSVKNRMEDYNTQVFQVSAHAGARPLCYPYQGKLYSWDNSAGELEDGAGKRWTYAPLNSTSYGQPAGLFGINCGHSPIPIIPGVSIPHAQDFVQPKEENDKQYAESQEQRALERKIRAAKRVVEMGDDSDEAKQRVRNAQKDMREFIERTGRTRRPDREQLYGSKKAPTPPREKRPEKTEKVKQDLTNNGVKDDTFKNTQGVSDDFKLQMARVLNGAGNEDAKRLYVKYADDLVAKDAHYKKGAFFRSRDEGIYFNMEEDKTGSYYQKPYEVVFHEFGHMIDYLAGGKNAWTYLSNQIHNGKRLQDVIKADYNSFKKANGYKNRDEVIEGLKKENLTYFQRGNISDILEACVNKGYPLSIGHGVKYHKRPGATEHEFFAEVLDSSITNPEGYEQMARIFPNAVKMVWGMIGEALNA